MRVGSSSGKLFVDDMTPRTTDEFLLGTAKQLGSRWSARLYGRYRESDHFWEDTNNTARVTLNPPPTSRASSTSPTSRPSSRRSAAGRAT